MRIVTVCFLLDGENVLLARKNGGWGHGHRGGYGGELKRGEPHKDAACREIWEESRIAVKPKHLKKCAVITVHREEENKKFQIHVYVTDHWKGNPKDTKEMSNPVWFPKTALPEKHMWPTDRIWLPWVLERKRFKAEFLLKGKKNVEQVSYKEVETFG